MAKKRSKKKAGKRSSKKGRRSSPKERTAKTLKIIKQRLTMHETAASKPDFHGGKLPVRSGCGRPRGS
jgi:hypothetical protein